MKRQRMQVVRGRSFRAERAWAVLDIARINGVSVRLHWTDKPYDWHVSDGEEVFAVSDGTVEVRYREGEIKQRVIPEAGDTFDAAPGCEHSAHPRGGVRVLLIEREGSV